MKTNRPDHSGVPFNTHAIPEWILPDLYNEHKVVRLRALWFVVLYALSMTVFVGLLAVPVAIYKDEWVISMILWLILGVGGGAVIGLANWWDFHRMSKKSSALKD
jgi:hypothetical protein